jgi:hypothetical protein
MRFSTLVGTTLEKVTAKFGCVLRETFSRPAATSHGMKHVTLCWALGAAVVLGCSAGPVDPGPRFGAAPGTPTLPVAAGASGSNPSGAVVPSGGVPLGFVDDVASAQVAPSCGGVSVEPERLPLDMYFLVDSSGSMAEPTRAGANKWDLVTDALVDFLDDPDNAQINAGIGYFPIGVTPTCVAGEPGCLCIPFINLCLANLGGSCEPADYSLPAVPLTLPPAPQRLIDDLATRGFGGGTPTRPALDGTFQYLATWASANPGRKLVAVLATDGEPTGCAGNTPQNVAELARAALAGPNNIQTFVIGVGGSLAALNQVAAAGGTAQAFLTDTQSDLQRDFASALDSIRVRAGACAFAIPERTERGRVDPAFVNVRVTPQGATQAAIVAKTLGGAVGGCGPQGGWFYDDPGAPTRIQLCDATCDAVSKARISVEFGCKTVVQLR